MQRTPAGEIVSAYLRSSFAIGTGPQIGCSIAICTGDLLESCFAAGLVQLLRGYSPSADKF